MSFLGLVPSGASAVVDAATGARLTYAELIGLGHTTAAILGPAKQVLFLVARNDAFTASAYWGAIDGGHAVALLDASAAPEMTAGLIDTYRPTWLAGVPGLAEQLAPLGVGIDAVVPMAGGELVRTTDAARDDVYPELALMLTTSGTTGSRKLVRLTARNLEANADSIADCLSLTPDERPLAMLPIHYSFGLSVVNSHWRVGATVVLTGDGVMQRRLWTTFDAEACTSLAGVPYTYQMLERIRFREMGLPSLRSMQQAGGALDLRLAALYRDYMAGRGGRFFVMYGQTEATARIAVVPPDRLADKLGSAGLPVPGGRFLIAPEPAAEGSPGGASPQSARAEMPPTTGELEYLGPNVMLGYASRAADLALGDELGGRLATGDIGYLDSDGYLFLVGRSKRIAKVFGHRVNLDEIEMLVRAHGPAAAVAGEDSVWVFCAFPADEDVERARRSILARLHLHPSGLQFRRVPAIPTTGSGKVDYTQVMAWVT